MQSYDRSPSNLKKALVGLLALVLALAMPLAPVQAHDDHDHDGDSRPDLIVENLTLSATPEPGETVQVSFTVTNVGDGVVRESWADVRLLSEDYSLYFYDYIEGLAPGASETFVVNWTAPERVHVLTAMVDRWDNINETNESNNEATLEVTVGDPKPDLNVWGPLLVPSEVFYGDEDFDYPWRSTVRDGDAMTLYASIRNDGTAPAYDMRVRTYLNGTLYDEQVIHNERGYYGQEYLVNWTAIAGAHSFRVVVDPLDEVDEKNETDNEETLDLTVLTATEPVPDLAVVSVDLPEDAEVGDWVEVTATIENIGNVTADAFETRLYVANLGMASMGLPGLDPGEQATISVTGSLPVDGYYYESSVYWGAVVDPFYQYDPETGDLKLGGDVAEDNETNNYFTGMLPVRLPDLVISDVRLPEGPFMPGDKAIVEVDISNIGDAGAYAAFDVEFRSHDSDTRTVYGLSAGETITLEFPMTIWGNHYSTWVRVDSGRVIGEKNEYNNTVRVEDVLDSEIGAVLEADDDEIWTGQVLTLTARFQNSGDLWHPEVYAEFYVDGEYLKGDHYSGVDDKGEIVAKLRWTPLQEGITPQYGDRNFTVELYPYWFDDDWSNNTASVHVTVNATPLPLPV